MTAVQFLAQMGDLIWIWL